MPAMTHDSSKVPSSTEPAMRRTLSVSRAPQACPTSTEAPVPSPMAKAMQHMKSGKKLTAAASERVPSSRPR